MRFSKYCIKVCAFLFDKRFDDKKYYSLELSRVLDIEHGYCNRIVNYLEELNIIERKRGERRTKTKFIKIKDVKFCKYCKYIYSKIYKRNK